MALSEIQAAMNGGRYDVAFPGPSGKSGIPYINRKRLPGWSKFNCFQDATRSLPVKGRTSGSPGRVNAIKADDRGKGSIVVDIPRSAA